MHILIAPNAFKNSLTAQLAAAAIEKGFQKSALACTTECFPIGDGGDGTGDLLIERNKGKIITVAAADPLERTITATYGLIDNGTTAVIEMANASGLRLLKTEELDPLRATSYGTGQLLMDALNRGVGKIIIAMGGSATVDGGTGILRALGMRFLDSHGKILETIAELTAVHSIDLASLDQRILQCEVTVLCDVDNHLLGDAGSAAMFGPQKGAGEAAVIKLEAALSRLAEVVYQQTGKEIAHLPYGGTAGGAAAGLYALLNASLVNGAESFLSLTGFEASLASADLVVTGEGSIDEQTLQGKGPYAVAHAAKQKGLPVIGLAGRVPSAPNEKLMVYFDRLLSINKDFIDLETALASTAKNLEDTSLTVANELYLPLRNEGI